MQRRIILAALIGIIFQVNLSAAIILRTHYQLGETEALTTTSGTPVDSVAGRNFVNRNGTTFSETVGFSGSLGSTIFANDSTVNGGYYTATNGSGTGLNAGTLILNTNWAMDVYAMTTNLTQGTGDLFEANATNNGSAKFTLLTSGTDRVWTTSLHNIVGLSNSAPIVSGEWSRLTFIRSNNDLRFYVNGIQVGGTANTINTATNIGNAGFHLGVNSGGTAGFIGSLDDLRIYSFDSTDNFAAVEASLFAVPEPATWISLLSCMFCAGWTWNKRRRSIC